MEALKELMGEMKKKYHVSFLRTFSASFGRFIFFQHH